VRRACAVAALDARFAKTQGGTAVMIRNVATLGLLTTLGLLFGAAAPEAITLDLFMIDYKFVPDHLTFQHDVHYRLHLENHGKETHEVTAPTFFATAKIDNPDALNHEHSEIVMQPGETKDVFLTPGKPGTYDLRCADHDWNGMVGGITVE
jgi:plastocyanin